jgi:hypothetical protein
MWFLRSEFLTWFLDYPNIKQGQTEASGAITDVVFDSVIRDFLKIFGLKIVELHVNIATEI